MDNPVELIIKKRSGEKLKRKELEAIVRGYIDGSLPDYQMSAFLMALFLKGMDEEEVQDLTEIYIASGKTIEFSSSLNTVDKHSTGGVGDKISLMLAPLAAACGAIIPMISGRGLGHTGGTLDKLESIPGFRTDLNEKQFRKVIEQVGFSIISQSKELVPADRKIYALRDVTGTVESLPLITASIISKKVAEGAQNLVIDLKVGTGAFIKDIETARKLGALLKRTGEKLGQKINIVYSNMNAPLGYYIGNALEVRETIEYLQGKNIPDIDSLTRYLVTRMLILSGNATAEDEAADKMKEALSSGRALERFAAFIEAQGGDSSICDDVSKLPRSKETIPIRAERDGWVEAIDCQQIGYSLLHIGAGRKKIDSPLDHAAGAYLTPKIGERIEKGAEIGKVFCADRDKGLYTVKRILAAYRIVAEEPKSEDQVTRDIILGKEL